MENNIVEYIYKPENYPKIIDFYSGKSFVIGNKKNQLPLEFIDMVIGNYGLLVATQVNNHSDYLSGIKHYIGKNQESGLVDHLLFTLGSDSNNIYDNDLNVIDPKYTLVEGDEVFIVIRKIKEKHKLIDEVVSVNYFYFSFFNKKYSGKYPILSCSLNMKYVPEYFKKNFIDV